MLYEKTAIIMDYRFTTASLFILFNWCSAQLCKAATYSHTFFNTGVVLQSTAGIWSINRKLILVFFTYENIIYLIEKLQETIGLINNIYEAMLDLFPQKSLTIGFMRCWWNNWLTIKYKKCLGWSELT